MKIGALEPIAALNRVVILDTGEPLVDIREFCPAVHVTTQTCPYLRRTVAEMLNCAVAALPEGHSFRVGTALRTLAMQKGGWDGYYKQVLEAHPMWPLSALRRAANRYFAPYDQPAPPGHCTGGAVDVQLLGRDGEPLDVTSPTQGWEAAYTWSAKLSSEARRNRMILVYTMLNAGFSNCREEFWHYSWGDSAWAVRVGEKTCPYGLIVPPVAVESGYDGAFAESIRQTEENIWSCRPVIKPDGQPMLDVGIFWTQGKEVTLQFEWPPPMPETLYVSADRNTWEPVAPLNQNGLLCLTLVPTSDRFYLASEPSPANPKE